jgi:endo-1,4-beta-D-glucanase Y
MKDAVGHDRMYVDRGGWISVDPKDLSITISDGDGYTLPQTIFCKDLDQIDDVMTYIGSGENPKP